MGLRKGQKELVEKYRGGYCAVPAIPGGGKTYCLTMWAAEIISQGLHKPGKILIVTYMNSAANNFKQRLSSELARRGIEDSKDFFVSTIHGLCLEIVKEKPDVILADNEFEIVDDAVKRSFLSRAVYEWRTVNDDRFKFFVEEQYLTQSRIQATYKNWHEKFCALMSSCISDFKCRGMEAREALEKCMDLDDTSILKCASEVYAIYDRNMKISGYLDFDDMLCYAKKILKEDASLLSKYRNKFTFVCEDEAQDSNRIQTEILEMIAGGNLLRVGDSNQAICGSFTSSDSTLFKNFCNMPETVVYNITQSSRNTREIIDLANYLVRYVMEKHPVPECRDSLLPQFIETVGKEDEFPNPVIGEYGIKGRIFRSWEEEARAVARQAQFMTEKYRDKTIAILAPTHTKIEGIVDALKAYNVQFEELDSSSHERSRPLRIIGRILKFLSSPENGEVFVDMVNDCYLDETFTEVSETGNENIGNTGQYTEIDYRERLKNYLVKQSVYDILYPVNGETVFSNISDELSKSNVWRKFRSSLDSIRELLEIGEKSIEELILHISDEFDFGREEKAIAQKVAGDIRFILSQNPHWCMNDIANEILGRKNRFTYFADIVWELKGYEAKPGRVTVCTYHKAKGLEWDIVFLTGLTNSDFPVELNDKFLGELYFLKDEYKNPQALARSELDLLENQKSCGDYRINSKIETIKERTRLLYVGITRARERLFLSGYESNAPGKNGGLPSKYLTELIKFIKEAEGGAGEK